MRVGRPTPKMLLALAGLLALAAVLIFAPHPNATEVREWALATGPLLPIVFFAVHVLVTIAPFPRTVFTVSAGLLFGPMLGIALAVSATAVSAVLALLIVRYLGRDWVGSRLTHPSVRAVDDRLARRGWLAVGSLRMIGAIPFSIVNYCAGVSSVRVRHFALATLIGVIPGTVSLVVLGDALTGSTNFGMLAVSAAFFALGIAGLALDHRLDAAPATEADPKRQVVSVDLVK
ncbi:MAG TPA: TVP38/TMEM64 family protein [Aldersonia sp.]